MIYNPNFNEYTKKDLEKIGIYDLRELGREIGVPSPTSMKKEQLIDYIVGIIHGNLPKTENSSLRGRPAKTGQKPYQKFVDLIDKIEAPKINSNFVGKSSSQYDVSFPYQDTISSKVASYKDEYRNDASEENDILQKGVVCAENDNFVVRKLRFVSSASDVVLPLNLVKEYAIKDNDMIDYFVDDDKNVVSQIIKINGKFVSKLDMIEMKNKISCPSETLNIIDKFSIKSKSSYIIISSLTESREKVVEKIAERFGKEGYSICKVCFDVLKTSDKIKNDLQMTEYYPESIGDEFESVSMIESAIERAKFYSGLGCKTLLVLDNFNWLLSVVESYPVSVYGNFIQKLARLGYTNQITVACVSGNIDEEKMNKLIGLFDYIINVDKFV